MIFDTALAVEAQILGDGAVGQLADVLGGNVVQPGFPVAARQGEHHAMRAVHYHGLVHRGALLAEGISVMPDGAGVGTRVGGGNC